MFLKNVLFVGGPEGFSSVRMRCVDMAKRLGCAFCTGARSVDDLPRGYRAYILVKPAISRRELRQLAKQAVVMWDVIDRMPPAWPELECCIVSTAAAGKALGEGRKTVLIPHYHCNLSSVPNRPDLREPAYIGSSQWCPLAPGFTYDFHDSTQMKRRDVASAYRSVGIGLNLRWPAPGAELHVSINSGIKLINCLGFGIPSVSADEPAYREIGGDCTLFATPDTCVKWVRKLQTDKALYDRLRANCLRKADAYHIDSIAKRYRAFIQSL